MNKIPLYTLWRHMITDLQESCSYLKPTFLSFSIFWTILLGVQFCFIELYWVSCCLEVILIIREVRRSSYLPSLRVCWIQLSSVSSSSSAVHLIWPGRLPTCQLSQNRGSKVPCWRYHILPGLTGLKSSMEKRGFERKLDSISRKTSIS